MAREQVSKSEQITPTMSIVCDYDQPLTSSKDILKVFNNALGGQCSIVKYQGTKIVYCFEHDNIKEYFLAGAITYLSKPHPLFKKRYQLKKWYKEFYNDYKDRLNTKIHLIGIYHYDGLIVFCEFEAQDYINRKLNSSAAHVYSNDIYQALTNGVFQKIDKNNNHIHTIKSKKFRDYILGVDMGKNIFNVFADFNRQFSFGDWIPANQAIIEMKEGKWYQWKGTEWPGWFLEYRFSKFITENNCNHLIIYIGNIKSKDKLDFDLFFPQGNYYGDLKSSDIKKGDAPANDQNNVLEAIAQNGKLWYVIYEHETILDKDKNNEMALERMRILNKPYTIGDKISYSTRMKHSVNFKRMKIFELNRINMNESLKAFNQGHQPNGAPRSAKFSINKRNIDNYIVYSYEN